MLELAFFFLRKVKPEEPGVPDAQSSTMLPINALVRSSISHLPLSFYLSTEPPRWERKGTSATMWNVLFSEKHPQHLFQSSYRVYFLIAILSSPVTVSGRKKLLIEKPQIPNKCHSEPTLTLRELVQKT